MAAALSFHFIKTIINCFYFTTDYALKLTVYILLIQILETILQSMQSTAMLTCCQS